MSNDRDVADWLKERSWPELAAVARTFHSDLYRHPYGFVVMRLDIAEFPNWGIRLHLWPGLTEFDSFGRRNSTIDQRVHSHGWDIWTAVVLGAVEQVTYEPGSGNTETLSAYEVASDPGTGFSYLNRVSPAAMPKLVRSALHTRADPPLLIPTGVLHETTPAFNDGWSVTVASTAHANSNESIVLAPSSVGKVVKNDRSRVDDIDSILCQIDEQYELTLGDSDEWVSFAFLLRRQKVLLVRSRRFPNLWQPVGGTSKGEDASPLGTLMRELQEETGMRYEASDLSYVVAVPRDSGTGLMHVWSGSLLTDPVPLRSEILEYRWFSLEDALELEMFSGARTALREVVAKGFFS